MHKFNEPVIQFIFRRLDRLLHRQYLLDVFTLTAEEPVLLNEDALDELMHGKPTVVPHSELEHVVDHDVIKVNPKKPHYAWVEKTDKELTIRLLQPVDRKPLLDLLDWVKLPAKTLPNQLEEVETTLGTIVFNYHCLIEPFGTKIPYFNELVTGKALSKLENQISDMMTQGDITVNQFLDFINNLYYIGHFSELCVPSITEKALTTHPESKKVREEFMKGKTLDQLADPAEFTVLEKKLVAMDKEHLKGDPAERFYAGQASRAYDIQRKKMVSIVGGLPSMDPTKPFVFVPRSLEEGWEMESFDTVVSEIRKGSYARGVETQKGGVQTKYITRIFQDLKVVEDDCGSKRGLVIDLAVQSVERYRGRYLLNGDMISRDTMDKYKGKTITIRDPAYCLSKTGLCRTCMGKIFADLSVKGIGPIAIGITSTFTTLFMKAMHGVTFTMTPINYKSYFVTGE